MFDWLRKKLRREPKSGYWCEYCEAVFDSQQALYGHMAVHYKSGEISRRK